jgi:hypothetical protein
MTNDQTQSPYQRKCGNWLQTFMEWTVPRSESPEPVLLWCGLFTLAAAVRRHIKVPRKYLGGWECYPSLFVTFVAPQGVIRKSTSMDFAGELLEGCTFLTKAPTALTVPTLMGTLEKDTHSACYILSSEFSDIVQKAGPSFYEIMTSLFDNRKNYDESTISRGYKFVENPVVNMLAATTPKWVAANMSEAVLGGGYGSRVIYLNEDTRTKNVLFYDDILEELAAQGIDFDSMKESLLSDLQHIALNINGEFTIAPDAKQFLKDWYAKNHSPPPGTDPKLTGFYQRKPAHILKIAQLLHIAYSDELVLQKEDFEEALKIIELVEPKIRKTFQQLGKNEYINETESIRQYIKEKGSVTHSQLLREHIAAANPENLEKIISGLVNALLISAVFKGGEITYDYNKEFDI